MVEYRLEPLSDGAVSLDPGLQRRRAELQLTAASTSDSASVDVVARIDPDKLWPPGGFESLEPGQRLLGQDGWYMTLIAKIGKTLVPGDGYIVTARVDGERLERITESDLKAKNPWLLSLKLAPAGRPQVHRTANVAWGQPHDEPDRPARAALTGKGVIVGVVDYGCDFASPAFRHPGTGATRLLAIWDQNGPDTAPPDRYGYGREFSREDIDAALQSCGYGWDRAVADFRNDQTRRPLDCTLKTLYRTLGYDPGMHGFSSLFAAPHFFSAHGDPDQPPPQTGNGLANGNGNGNGNGHGQGNGHGDRTGRGFDAIALHGTHVMDIAAGTQFDRPLRETRTAPSADTRHGGIAPDSDLVFVQVRKSSWQGAGDFTASSNILDAVRYILDLADETPWDGPGPRPVVVNLSLNAYAGPHDGRTLLEMGLDALAAGRENTAIVLSAANNQRTLREHRAVKLGAGSEPAELDWVLPKPLAPNPKARSIHEVEVWYPEEVPAPADDPLSRFRVGFVAPDGTRTELSTGDGDGSCRVGQAYALVEVGETGAPLRIGEVYSRYGEPNNGKGTINLILYESVAIREWFLKFGPTDRDLTLHAWIEYNQENPSTFRGGSSADDGYTLGSVCGTYRCVIVGSHAGSLPNPGWFNLLRPSEFTSNGPLLPAVRRPEGEGEPLKPDLLAPGESVARRTVGGAKLNLVAAAGRYGGGPVLMQGTSQAAPHVAGAIALLMQKAAEANCTLSSREILDLLHAGCSFREGWHPRQGHGLLDIGRLMAVAREQFARRPKEAC